MYISTKLIVPRPSILQFCVKRNASLRTGLNYRQSDFLEIL